MKIRNKILLYFSTTVIAITAVSFTIIYILFFEYREEEFQQQQKEKIQYTIKMLAEYKELSENLVDIMDELTIHDFYDEKMLVFDESKKLIFSSVDDLTIEQRAEVLSRLSPEVKWIETKEEKYDLIGMYVVYNQKSYYAISKAYDAFGYTKMFFLRNSLIVIFLLITVIVVLMSQYLSNKISKPIAALANKLNNYDLSSANASAVKSESSTYEIAQLTDRFNALLQRTNEAFAFQKHTIHHISHQLKTPIAALVSELERMKHFANKAEMIPVLENQVVKAKSLGSIIDVLLEISKIESGQKIEKQTLRIDEMIFDIIAELNIVAPEFEFEVNYVPEAIVENKLLIHINPVLISQAFQNLMINCITYSSTSGAEIRIDSSEHDRLNIFFINSGNPISQDEESYLFNHFFRGENSEGKTGFGLGLVLTKKIIELNSAIITYSNPDKNLNVFKVSFPLTRFIHNKL